MTKREEARRSIADIIRRKDSDRETALWRSDIARMTDMLLWLYIDFARPCTYSKGSRIDFDRYPHQEVPCSDSIESIEKTGDGYEVTVDGKKMELASISDVGILCPLLRLLLFKEFCDWDYYCDVAGAN